MDLCTNQAGVLCVLLCFEGLIDHGADEVVKTEETLWGVGGLVNRSLLVGTCAACTPAKLSGYCYYVWVQWEDSEGIVWVQCGYCEGIVWVLWRYCVGIVWFAYEHNNFGIKSV